MPKIIEKLAYEYNELSDKAKQKLRDNYCEHVIEMDFEVECLETILEEMGFSNPKIAYSGFWSQGDGASFTCDNWQYKKGMFANIKQNYPTWSSLHLIAKELQSLSKKTGYSLEFSVYRTNHRYCHENTVECGFGYNEYDEKIQDYVGDVVKKLCKTLYDSIEKSYYDATSDEAIEDFYTSNEYLFDEKGGIL